MDEMANHGVRIRRYVEKYGEDEVEAFIDRCMSIDDLIDIHSTAIRRRDGRRRATTSRRADEDDDARSRRASRARTTWTSTSTRATCCKAEEDEKRKKQEAGRPQLPRAAREGRAAVPDRARPAEALAARRAVDHPRRGVLLRAAGPDQDHERRLGQLLALHHHDREGAGAVGGASTTPTTTPARWPVSGGRLNPYKLGIELFRDIEERWNKGQFGKE